MIMLLVCWYVVLGECVHALLALTLHEERTAVVEELHYSFIFVHLYSSPCVYPFISFLITVIYLH